MDTHGPAPTATASGEAASDPSPSAPVAAAHRGLAVPPPRQGDALFLDADGTLLEIAARPDQVAAAPGLVAVLEGLRATLDGALAFVSGRRIGDLDRIFAPLVLPAAGAHGLERRRADGTIDRHAAPAIMAPIRGELEVFIAERPGLLLEDKDLTIALHYRLAPHWAEAVLDLARVLVAGQEHALRLLEGKMVVEFQPLVGDKGGAILAFMEEAPFIDKQPIFLGDDVTDEDAFKAVNRLGGTTVLVGAERPSAARLRLPDVAAVHRWLAAAGSPS
jgi:trehalose 6-phosphate phosphatase